MAEIEQPEGTLLQWLLSTTIYSAQKLTISNRSVSGLAFKCEKGGAVGNPTGDITFQIMATDDDEVLASVVWGDAASIVDGAWMEKSFASAVTINEEVRLVVKFTNGDSNNRVGTYGTSSSVVADEQHSSGTASAWTEHTTWDATYRYTFEGGTSSGPTVTTQACTYVIAQSATGNGNLIDLGDSAVTQHGHCWGTSSNPTTSDSKTTLGTGTLGQFTSAITGLTPGTKYYVRAYATNTTTTTYGANVEIAGDVTTIGKRYWWVEGKEFHYYDQWGAERKIEGVPVASGLPWWYYY